MDDAIDQLTEDIDAWNSTVTAERSEREIFQRMREDNLFGMARSEVEMQRRYSWDADEDGDS